MAANVLDSLTYDAAGNVLTQTHYDSDTRYTYTNTYITNPLEPGHELLAASELSVAKDTVTLMDLVETITYADNSATISSDVVVDRLAANGSRALAAQNGSSSAIPINRPTRTSYTIQISPSVTPTPTTTKAPTLIITSVAPTTTTTTAPILIITSVVPTTTPFQNTSISAYTISNIGISSELSFLRLPYQLITICRIWVGLDKSELDYYKMAIGTRINGADISDIELLPSVVQEQINAVTKTLKDYSSNVDSNLNIFTALRGSSQFILLIGGSYSLVFSNTTLNQVRGASTIATALQSPWQWYATSFGDWLLGTETNVNYIIILKHTVGPLLDKKVFIPTLLPNTLNVEAYNYGNINELKTKLQNLGLISVAISQQASGRMFWIELLKSLGFISADVLGIAVNVLAVSNLPENATRLQQIQYSIGALAGGVILFGDVAPVFLRLSQANQSELFALKKGFTIVLLGGQYLSLTSNILGYINEILVVYTVQPTAQIAGPTENDKTFTVLFSTAKIGVSLLIVVGNVFTWRSSVLTTSYILPKFLGAGFVAVLGIVGIQEYSKYSLKVFNENLSSNSTQESTTPDANVRRLKAIPQESTPDVAGPSGMTAPIFSADVLLIAGYADSASALSSVVQAILVGLPMSAMAQLNSIWTYIGDYVSQTLILVMQMNAVDSNTDPSPLSALDDAKLTLMNADIHEALAIVTFAGGDSCITTNSFNQGGELTEQKFDFYNNYGTPSSKISVKTGDNANAYNELVNLMPWQLAVLYKALGEPAQSSGIATLIDGTQIIELYNPISNQLVFEVFGGAGEGGPQNCAIVGEGYEIMINPSLFPDNFYVNNDSNALTNSGAFVGIGCSFTLETTRDLKTGNIEVEIDNVNNSVSGLINMMASLTLTSGGFSNIQLMGDSTSLFSNTNIGSNGFASSTNAVR